MGLAEWMATGEGHACSQGLLGTSLGSLTRIQGESQGLWLPEMLMQRKGARGGEGAASSRVLDLTWGARLICARENVHRRPGTAVGWESWSP